MEATLLRPVSLKLEQGEHERLKSLADARHRKPHFLMKEAIRQYLDREEARESFKQEALASWQAYQETGQHLTGEEVNRWLDTWGTDQEKAAPACHD
ncbi:MAG: CopG family ribbon-helix-helix protein [Pseudomonadota bacterium]|nr:CopG family ribbon-helix-helix protein [Pseudomonadota bacterium]